MDGSMKVKSADDRDVTEEVRQSFTHGPQAFDQIVSETILKLNRQVIDGPSPEEDSGLRAHGLQPDKGT